MADFDPYASEPQSLIHLMDLDLLGTEHWKPEELGAILEHQLRAPLAADLARFVPDLESKLRRASPPVATFGQLLFQPQPPVELLEAVKRFAKASRADPESLLPDEISTVLYCAAIVAARLRCGRRITRMDDQALAYSLKWVRKQTWLDPQSRGLFDEAAAMLKADQH